MCRLRVQTASNCLGICRFCCCSSHRKGYIEPFAVDSMADTSRVEDMRARSRIETAKPKYTGTFDYHGAFAASGQDNAFTMDSFLAGLSVSIQSKDAEQIVFDISGIDAPIANALRRIMIAELPTMAIETVNIYNNTSILQDEVLAHRLGLVPIRADPRMFTYKSERDKTGSGTGTEGDSRASPMPSYTDQEETEENTLVFELKALCRRRPGSYAADAPDSEKYENSSVYARNLVWVPLGDQAKAFADNPPGPVHPDILLAKLRPGQELDLVLKCEKGIGREHAKWSPVSTAAYRLLPDIRITGKPAVGKEAEQLLSMCGRDVFDIEDTADGQRHAVVARPRNCSMCRNCIRTPEWAERVQLYRVKNHFIFSVETTGALPPDQLFIEAVKALTAKARDSIEKIAAQE
eukprot:SAG31_NODE_495_length_14864_cov_21.943109_5_plen_407_part_00